MLMNGLDVGNENIKKLLKCISGHFVNPEQQQWRQQHEKWIEIWKKNNILEVKEINHT